MGKTCADALCNNNSSKNNTVSYFRLPNDKNLREHWKHSVRRGNLPDDKYFYLCSDHFEPNCFERDLKVSNSLFHFLIF